MADPGIVIGWSRFDRPSRKGLPSGKTFELLVLVDLGSGLVSGITNQLIIPTPSADLPQAVLDAGYLSAALLARLDAGTLGFAVISVNTELVDTGTTDPEGAPVFRDETDAELLQRVKDAYVGFAGTQTQKWMDEGRYLGFPVAVPGVDIVES